MVRMTCTKAARQYSSLTGWQHGDVKPAPCVYIYGSLYFLHVNKRVANPSGKWRPFVVVMCWEALVPVFPADRGGALRSPTASLTLPACHGRAATHTLPFHLLPWTHTLPAPTHFPVISCPCPHTPLYPHTPCPTYSVPYTVTYPHAFPA